MGWSRRGYSALITALLPVIMHRLKREHTTGLPWSERFGRVQTQHTEGVWIHCASVGEVIAAEPLIHELQDAHPDTPIVITTMTATGAAQVHKRFPDVEHHVLPIDLLTWARRFIAQLKPRLAILMETELWPNLMLACEQAQVPVVVANGRMSAKSLSGYQRLPRLMHETLQKVSALAARDAEDAQRFVQLGLPEERVTLCGSIKFDAHVDASQASAGQALKAQWGTRPVWVAASTHDGEETLLLETHRLLLQQHPDCLLVLVPRHPQRFDEVAALITAADMTMARRSQDEPVVAETQVYLGDTMGELMSLLAAADMVFMGGSWIEVGGHNLLEPAVLGKPLASGPALFNFQDVADRLQAADALDIVDNPDDLARCLRAWIELPAQAQQRGQAAAAVVEANRGALKRQLAVIEPYWPTA